MQLPGILNTKARFNHALARLDGLESLPQAAPLRRKLAPAVAVGLGGALLVNHVRHAPTAEVKKKVVIRDVLVLGGTTAGILGAVALTRGKAAHHAHSSARTLSEQLQALFRNQLCDHGASGFVKLLAFALGGVLGGGLGGTVADAVNGEDLKKTVPMKLKEGIFQFFGNVAVCTGAIWLFSTGGKRIGTLLSQLKPVARQAEAAILNHARHAAQLPTGHPGLLPTGLTQELTTVLKKAELTARKSPQAMHEVEHDFRHVMKDWLPDLSEEKLKTLTADLGTQTGSVRQQVNALASETFRPKLDKLGRYNQPDQVPPGELRGALKSLGQARVEGHTQLLGVLGGLVSGVIGGAWASNHLNEALTKRFHLPEGHHEARLFNGSSKGWLSHQVGDRGIHWWDAILHVDDWPSVLYMAGVQALESMICVLYGISGFLTGVAGTHYDGHSPQTPPSAPASVQGPLYRTQLAFQVFQTPHA